MRATEGPWRVKEGTREGFSHYIANPDWVVCDVLTLGGVGKHNASLISAAPDMKAALTRLVDAIFAADMKHGLEDEIEQARLAIAKAEGL